MTSCEREPNSAQVHAVDHGVNGSAKRGSVCSLTTQPRNLEAVAR
jgi:hypothetical protein